MGLPEISRVTLTAMPFRSAGAIRFWRMGHGPMVSTLSAVGVKRCLWDPEVMASKPRSNSWSNSLIIIYYLPCCQCTETCSHICSMQNNIYHVLSRMLCKVWKTPCAENIQWWIANHARYAHSYDGKVTLVHSGVTTPKYVVKRKVIFPDMWISFTEIRLSQCSLLF